MHCQHTETRLNVLLDERRRVTSDLDLAEHLRHCPGCRELADRYDAMLVGVAALSEPPFVSTGFVERIVARVSASTTPRGTSTTIDGQPRHARTILVGMAVAASLLVALWPVIHRPPTREQQTAPKTIIENPAVKLSSAMDNSRGSQPLDLSHEHLWLATGRGLAEIPVTVRWVTDQYDRHGIGATLRPVATRLSATLEALSRLLPEEPSHPEMLNGGTGRHIGPGPLNVA